MKTLLILAWRNLWRKKRRTFITVSSVMFAAVFAIALMSMVTGMKEHMVESIVGNSIGYIQIQDVMYNEEPSLDHALKYDEVVTNTLNSFTNDIEFVVPRIQGFCLASKDMGTRGVLVTGIEPDKEDKMNNLSSKMSEGLMFSCTDNYAVVAEGLAKLLELSIGDTIVLLGYGFQGMTAAGKFRVGGIIKFLLPEQNNSLVYLPLVEAQNFFAAPDRLTNLVVMTHKNVGIPDFAKKLQGEIDSEWYTVYTWDQLLPDTVAAFEARDAQVKVFSWILYIIAGFGIFGTIITMMHERLREFGILLSIGLKRLQLSIICMVETLLISFIGVIMGVAVGFPLMYWLHKNPIQLTGDLAEATMDYGIEPVYSFSVAPEIFIQQGIIIFFIALLIGLYPVHKVFVLNYVKASRN